MRRPLYSVVATAALFHGAAGIAKADPQDLARRIIAEHCIECHRVPGFAEEGRDPEINAPDFETIADDRKTYTTERLYRFLRQPHFPMRTFSLSETDIQHLIAFIEALRAGSAGQQ